MNERNSNIFGQRLEILFEETDKKQSQLAVHLNVGDSTVSQWKTGKRNPDLYTVKKIADYFHVTTDYLLGRTKHPNELLPDNYSDSLTEAELEFAKKEGIVFVVVPEKVAQRLTVEKVKGFIQDIKSSQE